MIVKVPTSELVIGMYIHKFPGAWIDHPFLKGSFKLTDSKQHQTIVNHGVKDVFIDTEKGLNYAETVATKIKEKEVSAAERKPAREQTTKTISRQLAVEKAKMVCYEAQEKVAEMFNDARMGKAFDISDAAPLVNSIETSLKSHDTALLDIARLKNHDNYTYMHSVAVCGLMMALAKKMGFDAPKIHAAGVAGLFHDIGKAGIPEEILNKPTKLSDPEYKIIQSHPVKGHQVLSLTKANNVTLDVCLHHHEKFDGSGYPDKLAGHGISTYSRMGAICDVYDAITSNRSYKEGWDPGYALKKMASWKGHFDSKIFSQFVNCIGIYPVGTLVKISSGQLGVVIEQNPTDLLKPTVKTFYSTKSKAMRAVKIIDLAKSKLDINIVSIENAETWNVKVADDFWL